MLGTAFCRLLEPNAINLTLDFLSSRNSPCFIDICIKTRFVQVIERGSELHRGPVAVITLKEAGFVLPEHPCHKAAGEFRKMPLVRAAHIGNLILQPDLTINATVLQGCPVDIGENNSILETIHKERMEPPCESK